MDTPLLQDWLYRVVVYAENVEVIMCCQGRKSEGEVERLLSVVWQVNWCQADLQLRRKRSSQQLSISLASVAGYSVLGGGANANSPRPDPARDPCGMRLQIADTVGLISWNASRAVLEEPIIDSVLMLCT